MKNLYFRNRPIPCLLASLAFIITLTLAPSRAAWAIFLESDFIELNGASSTVDLWFFSFTEDVTTTVQAGELVSPDIPGLDTEMIIYLDDGTFSNILATSLGAGDASINTFFSAGSYIAVIANHQLTPGEFGPFQTDFLGGISSYEYEFNGPEPPAGEIRINCSLSGNLDGTYTTRVFSGGSNTCSLPTGVPEPSSGLLLALGGLLLLIRRLTA